MDASRRVSDAGPARDETDSRSAGYLADRLGHYGRSAFVAAHGELDVSAEKRIERGKIAFARHAKNMLHTLNRQLVDQNFAACTCIVLAAHWITSRSSPAKFSARTERASSASWPAR